MDTKRESLEKGRVKRISKDFCVAEATWVAGGSYFSEDAVISEEQEVPFYPFAIIEKTGFIPATLLTPHPTFREALLPLAKALSFQCVLKDDIPALNEIMELLFSSGRKNARGRGGKRPPASAKKKKRK
jgi:hypothetical protein